LKDELSTAPTNEGLSLGAFMVEFIFLFRADKFYATTDFNYFSSTKVNAGYYLHSELQTLVFKGNTTDEKAVIVNTILPEIPFSQLYKLWMSPYDPDNEQIQLYERLTTTFLDKSLPLKNRVAFSSYSRSGNSHLRSMLEKITKIYTGSAYSFHDNTMAYQL
jgi:hypothetical protein